MIFGDKQWYKTPRLERRNLFFDYLNCKNKFTILYHEAYDLENSLLYQNGLSLMDWLDHLPRCVRKKRIFLQSDLSHGVEKYREEVYALMHFLSENNVDILFDIAMYTDIKPMHWIIKGKKLFAIVYNTDLHVFEEYEADYYLSNVAESTF